MRLHKTGHDIADTVSDLIGELPDGDYRIAYGILRHNLFSKGLWFEIDKGFWGSNHYDGNYRLSFKGTQPIWHDNATAEPHGLDLEPWHDWRDRGGVTMICPPTQPVCKFFNLDYTDWLMNAVRQAGQVYEIRNKGMVKPIDWAKVSRVITFNSTTGVEALRRGIPVISDPDHSTIGSYTKIYGLDGYDRGPLLSFMSASQFKLNEKEKICSLIKHYLFT